MKERVLAVGVEFDSVRKQARPEERLAELTELSASAGLEVSGGLILRQKKPAATYCIGSGQAHEVAIEARRVGADAVIFEVDLSSTQQRNLEEVLQTKTLDRTQLILDIFAQRARSMEGKLQVELAQLKYMLPRLSGKGVMLSRLGGGVGTRGPGEQKLEVDRRRIRERIWRLARELSAMQGRRLSGIRRKKDLDLPLVALVGYTNAGKSSLFNALTRSDAYVQDRLFSTLDTTTRLLELPSNQRVLLVDTVGFVRDLPHHLVESFKATLEEAVHADVLLHFPDASRSDLDSVRSSVEAVLADLGVPADRTRLVLNKSDRLTDEQVRSWRKTTEGPLLISAKTGEGLDRLKDTLSRHFSSSRAPRTFFIPKEKLGMATYLYDEALVLGREDGPEGSTFQVEITPKAEGIFLSRLKPPPEGASPA